MFEQNTQNMNRYETLSGRMNELRKEGYVEDFNLQQNCIECREGRFNVFADEFKVDKFYRFEGPSDPSDSAILYAISSEKHGLKGVLVNGYGVYSNTITDEMLEKLEMK